MSFKPITFYVSRELGRCYHSMYLSAYPPRINPNDKEISLGLHWYFYPKKNEPSYSETITNEDLKRLGIEKIDPGKCLNLNTGEIIDISEAESVFFEE